MEKKLQFKQIISSLVDEIILSGKKSGTLHKAGDISDSGDEVEINIRDIISNFIPERYLVKTGHIVDSKGNVSPQIDIIIFDRLSTPKFFESTNNTVYYPIESVLAIGEIKKNLKSDHIIEFSKKISYIKNTMERILEKNTVYGSDISNDSTLTDILFMQTDRKYRNPLFTFIVSIEGCELQSINFPDSFKNIPDSVHILNKGVLFYGNVNKSGFEFKIEDEEPDNNSISMIECDSHITLSILLTNLIDHLNKTLVTPFSMGKYLSNEDFQIKGSQIKTWNIISK